MESERQTLPVRSLIDLLNEMLVVYGRQLWRFLGLTAIVQAPANVVAYFLLADVVVSIDRPVEPSVGLLVRFFSVLAVWSFATVFTYGAIAAAVGQHYINNSVGIGRCYARVWPQAASLALLAAVLLATMVAGASLAVLVLPLILALVALVYWAVGVPVSVHEGMPHVRALGRSYRLVRGSWWRTLGIGLLVLLVAGGLGILTVVPFAMILMIPAVQDSTTALTVVNLVSNVLVPVVVLPVVFISLTLHYYDLRVRKEDYNVSTLSRELGAASV